MKVRRPRICFVSPTIWPVFSRAHDLDVVGGAEVQQTLLARQFVAAGYDVSIVCMDHGQPDGVVLDGVTVYRSYAPRAGLPVLRFLHPRLTGLWAALRRANADVYYQRGAGMLTGVVGQFCRVFGRRFIFAGASDLDFDPALPLIHYGRDRSMFRYGLRCADAVVVQNQRQLRDCCANYGLESTLVRSCHVVDVEGQSDGREGVLWVGSIKTLKRPELFLDLARSLPELKFRMVGGGKGSDFYTGIEAAAAQIPNLEFVGFVPYHQVQHYFDNARVYVSTSEWEGFPNTFLQAWSRAVPTVSYFDTGSTYNGLAVNNVIADAESMRTRVQLLATNDELWQEAGRRCLECYQASHTPQVAVAAYEDVIASLMPYKPDHVEQTEIKL